MHVNLGAYYEALSAGPSHNYYSGRAQADITKWVEFFIEGVAIAFEKVLTYMHQAKIRGEEDHSTILRTHDPKQRKALTLFQKFEAVTSSQIGALFGFQPSTSSALCKKWVEEDFFGNCKYFQKRTHI